jgi:lysophospholipase L1-like esterase
VTSFAEGRDRAQIAREVDAFNAAAREEAEAAGAAWVDVTAASRRHGADPTYLAADGLHPSGAAYADWTDLILPAALAAVDSTKLSS